MIRKLFKLVRDFFRALKREDFGEFGVKVQDESGNLVPMDRDYMNALEAEVHELEKNFWLRKQAEAFATHGEAILKPQ